MDTIAESFPRCTAKEYEKAADGSNINIDKDGSDTAIFVFKTVADPFVGKMTFFKVMTGTLTNQMTLKNLRSESSERMAKIYIVRGKKQIETESLACGRYRHDCKALIDRYRRYSCILRFNEGIQKNCLSGAVLHPCNCS